MGILDEDILLFWKYMYENDVAYMMVGGFATNLHGFSRTTADMDIWIKDSVDNRKKIQKVLNLLEIGDFESLETTELIPGWTSIVFGDGFELDIMTSMKSLPQKRFDECYQLAPTALINDIPVKFLHLNQLIETKKASARPKDLIDLIELEKIKKDSEKK